MSDALQFRPLEPVDLVTIERQPSQELWLGIDGSCDWEQAQYLAAQPEAWAAVDGKGVVACFGINETFPGVQGVGWALLGRNIGARHLQLTRRAREVITGCGLQRVEMICRARDIEPLVAEFPEFDNAMLLAAAMAEPSPECRWAQLLGMTPAHPLRRFGAASETYILFERIASSSAAAGSEGNAS